MKIEQFKEADIGDIILFKKFKIVILHVIVSIDKKRLTLDTLVEGRRISNGFFAFSSKGYQFYKAPR